MIKIIWHGHACFEVITEAGSVVLDPYSDGSVPGLAPLSLAADAVLCSHEHGDHNNRDGVRLSGKHCGLEVSYLDTWHDDERGARRGPNRIHILKAEGMTAVHLGDLGCNLTQDELTQLKQPDVLMIPIGGHYTIDAAQAAEIIGQLQPRVVLPMHYRGRAADGRIFGYDVISTSAVFRKTCRNPVDYEGNALEVDGNTAPQTAFLKVI